MIKFYVDECYCGRCGDNIFYIEHNKKLFYGEVTYLIDDVSLYKLHMLWLLYKGLL